MSICLLAKLPPFFTVSIWCEGLPVAYFSHTHLIGRSVGRRGYCPLPTSYVCHLSPSLTPAPVLCFQQRNSIFILAFSSLVKENDTYCTTLDSAYNFATLYCCLNVQLLAWLGFSFILFYLHRPPFFYFFGKFVVTDLSHSQRTTNSSRHTHSHMWRQSSVSNPLLRRRRIELQNEKKEMKNCATDIERERQRSFNAQSLPPPPICFWRTTQELVSLS